jgi:lysozyme
MLSANRWLAGSMSAALISGAALWEGTRYYAYYDIAGVPTVCQGYTGKGIVFGREYSPEECRTFLHKELVIHSNGVLNCITQPLKQNEHDAFTLMAYNVGVAGFCSSRAAREFNSGNVVAACTAMYKAPNGKPVWSYAKKNGELTFVQGLYNRRKYEAAMCLGNPNAKLD